MAANLGDAITDLSSMTIKSSELTMDIIHTEILPKLPAKSLLRFKTVNKFFDTLISSPEFIRLHLRHSQSSNTRLLVSKGSNETINIYNVDSRSLTPSATFRWFSCTNKVVGSCNGLLLIVVDPYNSKLLPLLLLNPSTRSYIEFQSTDTDIIKGNIGFGFDDCSNDYKAVVVSDLANTFSSWRVTVVYSVNSKSWKVVDRSFTSDSIEQPYTWYNGLLINNHLLHWIFVNRSEHKRRLGCFDVVQEKWVEDVLFPDYYYDPSRNGHFLDAGVLEGNLFTSFVNPVDALFDVWVMKEYGVQESWMKLLSINIGGDVPIARPFEDSMVRKSGFFSRIEIPNGYIPVACHGTGHSEVLLRMRFHSNTLCWYNWESNAIIEPHFPNAFGSQTYFVEDSLVKLPDAKHFGALHQPTS